MLSLFVSPESSSITRISLNNTIFYLKLVWSTREESWYFSLLDVDKDYIIQGVKLTFGVSPTTKIEVSPLGGNLYILKAQDTTVDLGRNNFGQGLAYELIYLTTSEELSL